MSNYHTADRQKVAQSTSLPAINGGQHKEQCQYAELNDSHMLESDRRAQKDTAAHSTFTTFRHSVARLTPAAYQCKLWCAGDKCKYCTWENWEEDEQAIEGVYSHWVTNDLVAMSRPTTKAIEKFEIVEQFIKNGITSVVNLQHTNEHRFCGPGMDISGFSYNPELFMKHEIFHYNFGWPDFGVNNVSNILDMVKVLDFALQQGKAAVHCHAGLGRTGVLIACHLIWSRQLHPKEAIAFVRKRRPNSIQNRDQVQLVHSFDEFLIPIRMVFNPRATFTQYIALQQHALHGVEARVLRNVPKLVYVVVERIRELCGQSTDGTLMTKLQLLTEGDELFYENITHAQRDAQINGTGDTMKMIRHLSMNLSVEEAEKSGGSARPPHRLPPLCLPPRTADSTIVEETNGNIAHEDVFDGPPNVSSQIIHEDEPAEETTKRSKSSSKTSLDAPPLPIPSPASSTTGDPHGDLRTPGNISIGGVSSSSSSSAANSDGRKLFADAVALASGRYLPSCVEAQVVTISRSMLHFSRLWEELAHQTDVTILLALIGRWFHVLAEPAVMLDSLVPSASAVSLAPKMSAAHKWTIMYICSAMADLCVKGDQVHGQCATLMCDWMTWSRDERAEQYFYSCINSTR